MSVLVRGMEMPTSCDNCWALDDYGDYPRCRITEEQRGYNFPIREKRMDKCPLVPVPPHGRLVDADAAIDDIRGEILEHQMNGMKGTPFYIEDLRTMWQWLEDEELVPTIIPAEGASDELHWETMHHAMGQS